MTDHQMKPIAILTDQYADYQKVVLDSISNRLNDAGVASVCVIGGQLCSGDTPNLWLRAANKVYDLLDAQSVSGVILLSGSLKQGAPETVLNQFSQRFNLPLVSLGLAIPGVPSVIVNDVTGMVSLMRHLLQNPAAKHFGFIRGYKKDPYSMQRERVFSESLAEANVSSDRIHFINGNYNDIDTYQAVLKLLDENPQINTLVAANDYMAVSSVRAATTLGRIIPDDLTITGFDDTFEALQCVPALSTVRQPLVDMAIKSADMMLSLQNNSPCDQIYTFHSQLVTRTSTRFCGAKKNKQENETTSNYGAWHSALRGLQTPAEVELESLSEGLVESLTSESEQFFQYTRPRVANIKSRRQLHWWLNVCFEIEKNVLPQFRNSSSAANYARVKDGVTELKELLWGLSLSYDASISRSRVFQANLQHQTGNCNGVAEIVSSVCNWIVSLQPKWCYLVRLNPSDRNEQRSIEVLIHFENGEFITDKSASPNQQGLVPDCAAEQSVFSNLILTPVIEGSTLCGYLAVDPTGVEIQNLAEIARCIGSGFQNVALVRQLEAKSHQLQLMNEELSEIANTDLLTSLPNRRKFISVLTHRQRVSPHAVLFVDLDGFKRINDDLGHDFGDAVLQEVARRLQLSCKQNAALRASAYRLGGDEFTVIVRRFQSARELRSFGETLVQQLSVPMNINTEQLHLTASVGIAQESGTHLSADQLVNSADHAMYLAKSKGKNCVAIYGEGDSLQSHFAA